MSLRLCVLLWSRPGEEAALIDYEDRVLALLPDHGGQVLQRARSEERGDGPSEVQILEFPSQAELESYMADERRLTLARARDAAIARTEVLRVELVQRPASPRDASGASGVLD
jgi:uncharacterized protein (DUF1330 family)